MSKQKFNLLLITLFFVFTQGMWERLLYFIPQVNYIIDFLIVLFVSFQFKFSVKVPGAKLLLILLLLMFFIGIVNDNTLIDSFLYFRYTLFFYLIYNQLYTSYISIERWRKLIKFILFLILIQGVGSAVNIFILNQRIEGHVGLMSSIGGTTATAFPLLISNIAFLIFLFKDKLNKKEWLIFFLVLISVFFVGYASGKRGIYIIIPFFFILTIFLTLPVLFNKSVFKKKIFNLFIIYLLLTPVLIYGIQNSHGYSYVLKGSETNVEIILKAFQYAEYYEGATDQYGNTIGRSNTSGMIIAKSLSNPSLFILGNGYGSIKQKTILNDYGVIYGIVGFTRDIISGGWLLMLLTVILFFIVILKNNSIKNNFTIIFRRLLLLIFLSIHFFYSSDFTVSLKITFILALLLVLINSPVHYYALNYLIVKNKFNK